MGVFSLNKFGISAQIAVLKSWQFSPISSFTVDIGFMKIPENSARENFGSIIPDFREHFFGNFGFPDLEAF